jgi:hypothetical protein
MSWGLNWTITSYVSSAINKKPEISKLKLSWLWSDNRFSSCNWSFFGRPLLSFCYFYSSRVDYRKNGCKKPYLVFIFCVLRNLWSFSKLWRQTILKSNIWLSISIVTNLSLGICITIISWPMPGFLTAIILDILHVVHSYLVIKWSLSLIIL